MIVCLCRGVSDREIKRAIAEGARTIAEVTRRCGAGGGCGGCLDSLEQTLGETCEPTSERSPLCPLRPLVPA